MSEISKDYKQRVSSEAGAVTRFFMEGIRASGIFAVPADRTRNSRTTRRYRAEAARLREVSGRQERRTENR